MYVDQILIVMPKNDKVHTSWKRNDATIMSKPHAHIQTMNKRPAQFQSLHWTPCVQFWQKAQAGTLIKWLCSPSSVPNNVGDISKYNLKNVRFSQTVALLQSFLSIRYQRMECHSWSNKKFEFHWILISAHLKIYTFKDHTRLRAGCSTLRLHLY